MPHRRFPDLDARDLVGTRDALHGYAQVLGNWLKSCRPKRKHWWHASLRPSLTGVTTGVVHAGIAFEVELDLSASRLRARTPLAEDWTEALTGQSPAELDAGLRSCLTSAGIDLALVPESEMPGDRFENYSSEQASRMGGALTSVGGALSRFRAGLAEETSPIQVWPHHFDLSMLWFPGGKIAGKDPDDEEASDKQINFGFSFGDENIDEPYLYVTAYPQVDAFEHQALPGGAQWGYGGLAGVVLTYEKLLESTDRQQTLLELWAELLRTGRDALQTPSNRGSEQ